MHGTKVLVVIVAVGSALSAEDFHPPGGDSPAQVSATGTILPGGRFLKPYGSQIQTGPGPLGIAVSPSGTIATADSGYERFGVTLIEPPGKNPWRVHHIWARTPHSTAPELADPEWRGVTAVAFDSAKSLWVSEGASGRVRKIDVATGLDQKIVNLNSGEWHGTFTADLALDGEHRLLYVTDQGNARVVMIDARSGRTINSVRTGAGPSGITLSSDGEVLYVTAGNSLCVVNVHDPAAAKITDRLSIPGPSAVLAQGQQIYVSSGSEDRITVLSVPDHKEVAKISLAVPGLEKFRGVTPAGMSYDPLTKWLFVAEMGINAVGVVDTEKNESIGDIPVGWMPSRVAISGDRVFVTNIRGQGTGPSPRQVIYELGEVPVLHRGSVSSFVVPDKDEVLRQTGMAYALAGLVPYMQETPRIGAPVEHVVLIARGNRSFDEVLGDFAKSKLARFGMHGRADGGKQRFSVQDAPITPNQHAVGQEWAYSDNFYVDGDTQAEGDIWLEGGYPELATEGRILSSRSVEAGGAILDHLRGAGIKCAEVADGADGSDQQRADRIIAGLEAKYGKGGEPFPGFVLIRLPGDRVENADPENGHPYIASYVADNDFATGRILAYLSHSQWWRNMAVFVTETDTEDSLDHIDAHRTLLLAAGPWVKRGYVSHTNASFPGLQRTIFELLHVPAMNLYDATAASLRDVFATEPDYAPFSAIPPDGRIFDPGKVAKSTQ